VDIGRIAKIRDLRSFEQEVYDWDLIETIEGTACIDTMAFEDMIAADMIGEPERLRRLEEVYEKTGREEAYWAAQSSIRRDTLAGA
jgi:hypothetical protein